MATRKTTKKTTTTKTTRKAPAKKTTGPVIKILGEPEKSFRPSSARFAYWECCKEHEGKPVAEFIRTIEDPKTCPKMTPARQAIGTPEKGMAWWSWFVKQGLATSS